MIMNDFVCPFCKHSFPLISETHQLYETSFTSADSSRLQYNPSNVLYLHFYLCPHCKKTSVIIKGGTHDFSNINLSIYPKSLAKQFPEYIPEAIRKDYEEAYSIISLSPKASSSLARRCLQGMIRDFWGITKSRLIDEVMALKDVVPLSQWKAIDGIRSIGNIGAHMEKDVNIIIDVEPIEAEKLLQLIELLMDKWYIARHDEEELYQEIDAIANDKKSQKNI